MNHYVPVTTNDGTVIVRSSENACISVCCVFSTTGDIEIARFDNPKIAKSFCEIWNDKYFQQCRPFFGNILCTVFICKEDILKREIYDLDNSIYSLLDQDTISTIEKIQSWFFDSFGTNFLTKPKLLHPDLVQEIASMN